MKMLFVSQNNSMSELPPLTALPCKGNDFS